MGVDLFSSHGKRSSCSDFCAHSLRMSTLPQSCLNYHITSSLVPFEMLLILIAMLQPVS